MPSSPWVKPLLLLSLILTVTSVSLVFLVLHHEDGEQRIAFRLLDQHGEITTQEDLAGKHLLVFFGFTSCRNICPTQMSKISNVMTLLDETGHGQRVTPVFVSVDPERDSVEAVSAYLKYFHPSFVGLTGSRPALAAAADRFKTLLDSAPKEALPGYQIAHSSIIYVVDPYSRVLDFIPLAESAENMAKQVRNRV